MMMKLDYMNLSRQCQEHKKEFMAVMEEVYDNVSFSGGSYAKQFEQDFAAYIGTKFCSSVNSGTSALHLAFRALGIHQNDEVIIPANTFIASAWPALYEGAKPVFCDIKNDTWEIDAEQIESLITENTKAVVAVHLYGVPADLDEILKICRKHNLYIIEDCAQAHGALYKGRNVGTFGDAACFSFYPGKNLGAFGEGGAIVTNNEKYYQLIEKMKNHGSSSRYYHDIEGFNMRMDGIQGAVLSKKLVYLDEWNGKRRHIARQYMEGIYNRKVMMQYVPQYLEPVYHLFEIETEDREMFLEHMRKYGIYCGCHYPIPCHLQKVFSDTGYQEGDLPVSEYHAKHCVSLPMFPEMTEDEIHKVIFACNEY